MHRRLLPVLLCGLCVVVAACEDRGDGRDGGTPLPHLPDGGGPDGGVPDGGLDAGEDAGQRFAGCVSDHAEAALPSPPDGGYALFACHADRAWPRLAEVAGPDAVSTQADVTSLRARLPDEELMAIPGVVGVGSSLCCGKSPAPPVCLAVIVQTHTTPPEQVLDVATDRARDAGLGCLGVSVELLGLEGPRCDPAVSLACGPLAHCPTAHPGDPCCPTRADFIPDAGRVAWTDDPELNQGACVHDGDCFQNGAGEHCTSWQTPGFFAPDVCLPSLAEAHCGCVAGQCSWFTQPP